MLLSRLVIASKNQHKIVEILDVLASTGLEIELVDDADWPDVAETETTLKGNALLKAREVRRHTGFAVIADDTGLEVDALDGEPGVHSARFAGPDATYEENVDELLRRMDGIEGRVARFRTVMVLIDDTGAELVVDGVMEGSITNERRGTNGFGYDPVFLVGDQTFAEMGTAAKNKISHRALALRALAAELSRGA
ncbi:MAG: RdgB/HAM1 family non-canonical purine NTP pyrophosphatase [Actinomycetota bacterium]|nr:RdgB/HAM1 family non-canonical purine NTP pyrophosphatase [Actinomycetota bacterium]